MAQPRHKAVVAGLALTLTFGAVAAPAIASTSNTQASDSADTGTLPAPADYDKADFFEGAAAAVSARAASSLSPVSLSAEMKYFAQWESGCNYDQGFSYGDGYNALGYYQFDRRYGLMDFIQQVYNYNPSRYSMFKEVLKSSNKKTLANPSWKAYDSSTGRLKPLAQKLDTAWHKAYKASPSEFSALQDSYAYSTYYLPIERMMKSNFRVDISDRADCVKGLLWGMCNLFGQGGVQNYIRDAKVNDKMTDRQLVTALCDTVVKRVKYYCSSQPQYWAGWQNRYRAEKATCLKYIAEDEKQAEANKPKPPTTNKPSKPAEKPTEKPDTDKPVTKPDTDKPDVDKPADKPQVKPDEEKPAEKPSTPPATNGPSTGGKPSAGKPSGNNVVKPNTDDGDDGPANKPSDGPSNDKDKPAQKPSQNGDAGKDDSDSGKEDTDKAKSFTVIFDDCDQDTKNRSYKVEDGKSFDTKNELPVEPARKGYKFEGWYHYDYEAKRYGEKFDPSAKVTGNVTVAAKWSKVQPEAPKPSDQEDEQKTQVDDGKSKSEAKPVAAKAAVKVETTKKEALPQTGDVASLATLAAAGMSAAGAIAVAAGGKLSTRRKDQDGE